jgi:hypothetical protein
VVGSWLFLLGEAKRDLVGGAGIQPPRPAIHGGGSLREGSVDRQENLQRTRPQETILILDF